MTVLPLILMYLSYYLYQRKYKLDEAEYEPICAAICDLQSRMILQRNHTSLGFKTQTPFRAWCF